MTSEAVCYALTAAGLVTALLLAARRRFLAAVRCTALALLPAGVYLAGLVPVARRIGRTLGDWGADLVSSPRVWTGLGLLALSLVLFAAARVAARRRAARTRPAAPSAVPGAAPGRPPALGAGPPAPPQPIARPKPGRRGGGEDDLGDFSEIEEILRRRGI